MQAAAGTACLRAAAPHLALCRPTRCHPLPPAHHQPTNTSRPAQTAHTTEPLRVVSGRAGFPQVLATGDSPLACSAGTPTVWGTAGCAPPALAPAATAARGGVTLHATAAKACKGAQLTPARDPLLQAPATLRSSAALDQEQGFSQVCCWVRARHPPPSPPSPTSLCAVALPALLVPRCAALVLHRRLCQDCSQCCAPPPRQPVRARPPHHPTHPPTHRPPQLPRKLRHFSPSVPYICPTT